MGLCDGNFLLGFVVIFGKNWVWWGKFWGATFNMLSVIFWKMGMTEHFFHLCVVVGKVGMTENFLSALCHIWENGYYYDGEVFTGFVLYLRRWAWQDISIDLGKWDFAFLLFFGLLFNLKKCGEKAEQFSLTSRDCLANGKAGGSLDNLC